MCAARRSLSTIALHLLLTELCLSSFVATYSIPLQKTKRRDGRIDGRRGSALRMQMGGGGGMGGGMNGFGGNGGGAMNGQANSFGSQSSYGSSSQGMSSGGMGQGGGMMGQGGGMMGQGNNNMMGQQGDANYNYMQGSGYDQNNLQKSSVESRYNQPAGSSVSEADLVKEDKFYAARRGAPTRGISATLRDAINQSPATNLGYIASQLQRPAKEIDWYTHDENYMYPSMPNELEMSRQQQDWQRRQYHGGTSDYSRGFSSDVPKHYDSNYGGYGTSNLSGLSHELRRREMSQARDYRRDYFDHLGRSRRPTRGRGGREYGGDHGNRLRYGGDDRMMYSPGRRDYYEDDGRFMSGGMQPSYDGPRRRGEFDREYYQGGPGREGYAYENDGYESTSMGNGYESTSMGNGYESTSMGNGYESTSMGSSYGDQSGYGFDQEYYGNSDYGP